VKYYVLDEKHKAIVVQIPIDAFEHIEKVMENFGLAKMMDETEDDDRLCRDNALSYYRSATDELESLVHQNLIEGAGEVSQGYPEKGQGPSPSRKSPTETLSPWAISRR